MLQAFDKVPHKKLLWKLNNYGIRGNTWKWVSAFLSSIMQQVALDGEVSGQLPVVKSTKMLCRSRFLRCYSLQCVLKVYSIYR
jgi:hypothetical protein